MSTSGQQLKYWRFRKGIGGCRGGSEGNSKLHGGNLKINVRKAMGIDNEHRAFMPSLQCVRERRTREWTIGYIIHVRW